ncbi:TIGR03084 family protein [Actinoalloteichus sp. AHMU CJ021]|uniref:TIGR03084 family protein n=1 Tax=Actinoalloteichus caeruleus DSM 43889 TaxID=1120930 RepID=A0ABT1JE37_ACTCY|nr:TIGR03084 family metal-binding protein [Actinoalloteichus caeruleus]AUS81251.1 TIGR03084 family protein [Actinoalloteichus sp. AHMU CJ021]MCP2330765.1 TIGR03084 family protein [Actinoalloteichus caeruleus DSM 43889]
MIGLADAIADLTAEAEEVDRLVADLEPPRWALDTPAPGWTIADQVAHLTFIFRLAETAAAEPEAFRAMVSGAEADFEGAVNAALPAFLGPPAEMLRHWRTQRDRTITALAAVPADSVVPWLVRPIPPSVLACAGLMELFGHGQDIADALGVRREATDRLRGLVGFAVLTRDFGYQARGIAPPTEPFRFEISGPSGDLWAFGPEDAGERVTGPARDFCLLVTRRRHHADLAVRASGAEARRWVEIAQAYRGPAGPGRRPGQF